MSLIEIFLDHSVTRISGAGLPFTANRQPPLNRIRRDSRRLSPFGIASGFGRYRLGISSGALQGRFEAASGFLREVPPVSSGASGQFPKKLRCRHSEIPEHSRRNPEETANLHSEKPDFPEEFPKNSQETRVIAGSGSPGNKFS
ncbi:MAG TPA: hypothetical protein VG890_17605 [Puia sp.]|nr:hypothetical protein [Puia sp.]